MSSDASVLPLSERQRRALVRLMATLDRVYESLPASSFPNARHLIEDARRFMEREDLLD